MAVNMINNLKLERHCEERSNLYIGKSTTQVRSVKHRDCFAGNDDSLSYLNIH